MISILYYDHDYDFDYDYDYDYDYNHDYVYGLIWLGRTRKLSWKQI